MLTETSVFQEAFIHLLKRWGRERLHAAVDADRCRNSLPNSAQSLGTLMEEQEEGWQALNGMGTLQEDEQNQLTWTLRASLVWPQWEKK